MKASIDTLQGIANQLRIDSIVATTEAGSGHVTSCCSIAEIIAALFFGKMHFDPHNPSLRNNDRLILSKGHAAPILYAAWAEAGLFSREQLRKLRRIDSDLEGHPTPRLPFVDVATGSLGQGLSAGVGLALGARLDGLDCQTYVILGDGECAEGSVWEAAAMAALNNLNNLTAIVDGNRLGQSGETAVGHNLEIVRKRFEAFGWRAVVTDGHDLKAILEVLGQIRQNEQPLAIVARTVKGKGLAVADKDNWHGKPLGKAEATQAIAELRPKASLPPPGVIQPPSDVAVRQVSPAPFAGFEYRKGESVATRKAFGSALARAGESDPRIVVLDGDVKNSTYTEKFFEKFPDRSFECYISEQNMVGVGVGLSKCRKIPVVATFACFLTRAFDQIRMAAISRANLKLCGSHAGVSIGEDGPSQMGLEDIAMMRAVPGCVVLQPCDAVSTERLVEQMVRTDGMYYIRTLRPGTPVIYDKTEEFPVGGGKVVRKSDADQVTVVASGITVHEALKAADLLEREELPVTVIDAYSIKPLPVELFRDAAARTNNVLLTVEDHYAEGGLGDAVAGALSSYPISLYKLAVREIPRSGKQQELLSRYRIDAAAIVETVRRLMPVTRGEVVEATF